jgi:DNA-binding CsgD family transcriptional regulator/tetratricopeptide (TPR) repeat protein
MAIAREVGDDTTFSFAVGHLCQCHILGRGDIRRGLPLAEQRLADVERANDTRGLASAWFYLGTALLGAGRLQEGEQLLEAAAAGFESVGNTYWLGAALGVLSGSAWVRGDRAAATTFAERIMALDEGFNAIASLAFQTMALIDLADGRYAEAERWLDKLEERRLVGNLSGTRGVGSTIGVPMLAVRSYSRLAAGDAAGARTLLIDVLRSHVDLVGHGVSALFIGALIERADGELLQANKYIDDALGKTLATDFVLNAPTALEIAAALRGDLDADVEAARLLAAAAAGRTRMGTVVPFPAVLDPAAEAAAVRERLGDEAFAEAWAAGEALSLEEALEYAIRGRGPRQRPQAGWDSLTPTELKVVALVAEGLSNPQIAERLFISRRTVSTHLSHVFAKVGVSSRAELAVEATKRAI